MRLWTVRAGAGAVSVVPRPLGDELLVSELTELREAGVDVLVSLLDRDELPLAGLLDEELVAPFVGLAFHHLPTPDQTPPDRSDAVLTLVADLAEQVRAGRHVAVPCHAGHGRSPALAAAVLVMTGLSPEDAMAALSQERGRTVPHRSEQQDWVRWVAQAQHELRPPSSS